MCWVGMMCVVEHFRWRFSPVGGTYLIHNVPWFVVEIQRRIATRLHPLLARWPIRRLPGGLS